MGLLPNMAATYQASGTPSFLQGFLLLNPALEALFIGKLCAFGGDHAALQLLELLLMQDMLPSQ